MLSSNTSAVSGDAVYVEDVFSTYLYTGNGSTQTITNGIDLSTKGGMVWTKARSTIGGNWFCDTARGNTKYIFSNGTSAQSTYTTQITSFNTTGFSLGSEANANESSQTFASWTFRKQPKFFDVVTYTGTGSARTVAHNLGSVPGCIIVKNTSNASNWIVYHRSTTATQRGVLNTTSAFGANSGMWNDTEPTSTVFTVGTGDTNTSGNSFVAYIFAHDAGGFGLTGTDNVISCGSFTTDGSGNATVSLGYEPQWMLVRSAANVDNWLISDSMRGQATGSNRGLLPNVADAESSYNTAQQPTATGFTYGQGYASSTYIYIAIRRGPMKVPTDGTKVFTPLYRAGTGSNPTTITTGFAPDLYLSKAREAGSLPFFVTDRLRGGTKVLSTSNAIYSSEATDASWVQFDKQTTIAVEDSWLMGASFNFADYFFKRAPSFFDEVCYIQPGSSITVTHNLKAVPELIILKNRNNGASNWMVYSAALGNTKYLNLETNGAETTASWAWDNTSPTSTTFVNGYIYPDNTNVVAYLFATCAGVSKVGSYTGTGTTKQVDCGFAAGARFVLIKRTDSTGDWYVWDTARGIVSGNDPYLLFNSTATEVTNTDYVDTYSAGFEISSTAPAALNASGGTYIFLAIA